MIVGLIFGGIFLCCLLPIGLVAGVGLFAFGKVKDTAGCGLAMGHIQRAMILYSKDHEGKLPKAATWMDDVRPYYHKAQARNKDTDKVFGSMPDGEPFACTSDGVKTGIAFNKDLSGKKVSDIKEPMDTVLVFETTNVQANLSETYKEPDFSMSPKVFGKHRGWMKVFVAGNPKAGNADMNFNVSQHDDSPATGGDDVK